MVQRSISALIQSEASPESRQMTWTLVCLFVCFLIIIIFFKLAKGLLHQTYEVEGWVPEEYSLFYLG